MMDKKILVLDQSALPNTWVVSILKDVAQYIQRGKGPKYVSKSELPVINQKCIRWFGVQKEHLKYVDPLQWSAWAPERYVQLGDILWNSTGTGTIGRAAIIKHLEPDERYVVDSHVTIIRPKEIDSKYVHYWIMSPSVQSSIEDMQLGSTNQVELSKTAIEALPIPIAPKQQQRIVSKLEELFSELDKGIESFKTARKQLKVYRQAVLKHAFEGKLTEEWRKKHADELEPAATLLKKIKAEREQRYQQQLDDWEQAVKAWEAGGKEGKKPKKPGTLKELPPLKEAELAELPELPEEWKWVRILDILDGSPSNGKSVQDQKDGFPVLRLTSIRGGIIDILENKCGAWSRKEAEPYLVNENDFLLSRGNGSKTLVGLGGLVPSTSKEIAFPDTMVRVIPSECGIKRKLFAVIWNSKVIRKQIESSARTTAGIYKINQQHICSFAFPLIPTAEQEFLASQIESRLSVVEKLEQDIEDGLKQAETLRQSLLKKAFEGKLAAQDPNDEPASVLLKRIKTEKTELEKKTRPRNQKKKVAV